MKKQLLVTIGIAIAATPMMQAQETVEPYQYVKQPSYLNPISALVLCADPTSVEYDGRLYVYASNDHQEYDANGGTSNNTYGNIKTLAVFSTEDMVNWTHHGTIDMKAVCGSWMGNSWAPSICSREEEDGLTHFYMYFSNGGGGVGVVTATSPLGPWTSPLNHALITGGTPGLGACSWPFDPGVVIDDNGVGWLAFGGGDPVSGGTKLQPGNARIVRLGKDMVSLDSEIAHIDAPYEFEASELNVIGGKLVYTYCSSWSDRNDWAQYGSEQPAPSTCSMCYMVTDTPLDRESWRYGGEILKNPGAFGYNWGNNHTHMHKYKGEYYMLYHTQVMEQLAGITGGYRSVAVNKATVDEDNVVISPITANNTGAPQIKSSKINAFERQQAETMWNAAGVSIVAEKDAGNTSISRIKPGGWVAVRSVSFEDDAATTFTAKIRGKGRMEIHVANLTSAPVGVLEYANGSSMKEVTINLDTPIKGTKTVYFMFTEANSITRWDEWQFGNGASEGISDINVEAEIIAEEYYNLYGVKVGCPGNGIFIQKIIYSDGSVATEKVIR